jgi:hypothetical protein
MTNVIRSANGMKYRVKKSGNADEYVVIELRAQRDRDVFFGTKAECVEWIETNGHDEWN